MRGSELLADGPPTEVGATASSNMPATHTSCSRKDKQMKKKVWVVSYKQKDSHTYYPLLVVESTGDILSSIEDWKKGLGIYWEERGFDLTDRTTVQVPYYG
jgi:hypothetical protein